MPFPYVTDVEQLRKTAARQVREKVQAGTDLNADVTVGENTAPTAAPAFNKAKKKTSSSKPVRSRKRKWPEIAERPELSLVNQDFAAMMHTFEVGTAGPSS